VDSLAGFLNGPRARGAFLLKSVMDAPWALRIRDEAPLTVCAVVRGTAWVSHDDAEPVMMAAGDVAIMRGPDHYTMSDRPETRPQVIIGPGQVCTNLAGEDMASGMSLGVRTWGNSADGETVLLTGTYQGAGEITRRLLDALPRLAVLAADEWDCPVIPLLADEIGKDALGQEVVLDRLLDLLIVAVLRAWFDRPGTSAPAWYTAHTDPVVGRALRLLHNNPEQPWTVSSLAAATGVSRAALARRFTALVGEPPMAFLTGWRLALAADLLRDPDATLGAVARQVGYGSPYALSAAFKRVRGVSPRTLRRSR
jgi:AraC-like DNA-binding protein